MGTIFYLKSDKLLSLKELLNLNVNCFNIDENELDNFLDLTIDNFCYLLLGNELTARGFELSYDGIYEFRFFSPTSVSDFEVGFSFIKEVAKILHLNELYDENLDSRLLDELDKYDIASDILNGLNYIKDNISNNQSITLYGQYIDFNLSEELLDSFLNNPDPVKAFSDYFVRLEQIDAYVANQNFYKSEEGIIGVYTLTESVDTILPFKPFIKYEYQETVKEAKFKLALVIIDGDENDPDSYQALALLDFDEVILKLPKNKYAFIDSNQILVSGLTNEELKEMI